MSRADYTYTFRDGIFSIVDHNLGNMSVTNDIENIVEEICKKRKIDDPSEYKWIYQDSDGLWDGWNPSTNSFIHLQTHLESDAREQILYKK